DETGHEDDVDIHPDPQHEPPADTPVLQQMFATMTGLIRDVQQLQQSFTTLDLQVQDMQTDIGIVRASARRTQEDVSNLRRSTDRLIGRLARYIGMMDGMQFLADQTYDM
ncbi:Hypothetical predicted protein, partial [Olea europaea subsp. europaea]